MNRPTHCAVHQNAPSAAKGAGTAAAVASDSRCSCGRLNTSCGGGGRALCAPSSQAGTRASNQQRSPGWLLPLSPHCFGSTSPRARGVRKARPVRSAAVHALKRGSHIVSIVMIGLASHIVSLVLVRALSEPATIEKRPERCISCGG
eukprot:scaffold40984_cov61-Phaeocystis_antarctica.AAC.4